MKKSQNSFELSSQILYSEYSRSGRYSFNGRDQHCMPKWLLKCYRSLLLLAFGSATGQLLTEVAKFSIGRQRPYFLTVNTLSIPMAWICVLLMFPNCFLGMWTDDARRYNMRQPYQPQSLHHRHEVPRIRCGDRAWSTHILSEWPFELHNVFDDLLCGKRASLSSW